MICCIFCFTLSVFPSLTLSPQLTNSVNPNGQVHFHISKALNDEGMGTASSVIRGIEGCVSSGAKIINMSLGGGPDSKMFDGMFEDAYDKGILTYAASGNLGLDQDDFPANYPHVISVGAVDKRGEKADFSNWSDQTEIMGPGQSIMSTYPRNQYATLSGTSMATPYVAGVAALVWSYFVSLLFAFIIYWLIHVCILFSHSSLSQNLERTKWTTA